MLLLRSKPYTKIQYLHKETLTLFKFPNPSRLMAPSFQLGRGGSNSSVAVSFKQPRGIVTRTASALSVLSWLWGAFPFAAAGTSTVVLWRKAALGCVDCSFTSTPWSVYLMFLTAEDSLMSRPSLRAIGRHE